MKATFERSVDVLVKAYLNDTLDALDCKMCAVGNLIYSYCGLRRHSDFYEYSSQDIGSWYHASHGYIEGTDLNPDHPHIIEMGYTIPQILRIESAFMHKDDNFEGLLAVVDVLADIHDVDLSIKQNAVSQFEQIHSTK